METEPLRNVEIKANIVNIEDCIIRAKNICTKPEEILHQEDVFYNVTNGRLKLRKQDGKYYLVQYHRPDIQAIKLCSYRLTHLDEKQAEELHQSLADAIGIQGHVNKTRHLFMYGQTRIHLDRVKGLGDFLELEVVLEPHQTVEEGQQIADSLCEKLNVKPEDLLAGAYMNMLQENGSSK